jgi:hypothetical protein
VFTISVTNLNEAPTNIALSSSSVPENQAVGTTVGTLSTTDPDAGDTHSYALVAGTGDTDNGSFTITGTTLKTNAVFNFETKSSYSIRVRSTDSGALSFDKVFTISVTNINEAPTDIALSSSTVPENQASGTTVGTLSTTDPDAGDTFTYSLVAGTGSTDNGSFTITGSSLKTNAVFDFETKSSYSIRVRTTDAGALTFEKVFTISVSNVNEAPVNTVPGAQAVNEDTDLTFSAGNGNAISLADPDAGGNPVKLSLDVAHGTLTLASTAGLTFVDGTANGTASVHVTGTLANINTALAGLKYRGTANYNSTRGAESLAVVTNDQGNTGSGGPLSDSDSVALTVNAVNDAPTAATKSYTVQSNMKITGLSGLLTGTADPDTGDGGYTASFSVNDVLVDTCAATSTISNVNASAGTFDFDPAPGFSGTCTLKYRVNDSGNPAPAATSAYASINVTVSGPVIWFVNSAAAVNGNGRLSSPFNVLSGADAVDGPNQSIFLYSGTYATGIALNTGEKLVGQGASGPATFDALFGITPPTGTIARPAIATGTATVQGTVTLANTALLRGLALSTGTTTALSGTGPFSGIDVSQVSVTTTTGTAVNLNNAVGSYSFSSISTNGAANGILLDAMGVSTFTATSGSIVGATTRGVDINGGSGNFSYGGSITTSGSGRSVEVTSRTGGTLAFSGSVSDTGTGINLSSNTGATINFTGGLIASTGASTAFAATGGGTVTVTGSGNTLTTTTGKALDVENTTIGDNDLTLLSVSSNGAASGIILSNTSNANGRLFVTSTGTGTCQSGSTGGCSGGLIQNSTGAGISLSSVPGGAEFTRIGVLNGGDDGIFANGVAGGIKLSLSAILSNGNAVTEDGLDYNNVQGITTIQGSDVIGAGDFAARIANSSGTLNLTVNDTDFNDAAIDDGLQLLSDGTSVMRSNITGNRFSNNHGDGFQHGSAAAAPSASSDTTFKNNTITGSGSTSIDGGIVYGPDGSARGDISNNTITSPSVSALIINSPPAGTNTADFNAIVNANTIGTSGVADSGSVDGDGLQVKSPSDGISKISVTNNIIRNYDKNGMMLRASESSNGTANTQLTATGNTISQPDTAHWETGILLQSGSLSADNMSMCADVGTNTFTPPGSYGAQVIGNFWLSLRFPNAVMKVPNYTGTTFTDRQNYFLNRNTGFNGGAAGFQYVEDGSQNMQNNGNPGLCTQPTPPTLPTPP